MGKIAADLQQALAQRAREDAPDAFGYRTGAGRDVRARNRAAIA